MTRLDAVLPLTLKDVERAAFLLESLARNFSGLRRIWVICPDDSRAAIAARFDPARYPFDLHVESELAIVPEFSMKVRQSGWFRQQMIKLAIYEHVDSDLYLTLDADVVCARPVTADRLAGTGRGACFVAPGERFEYWYDRVERVLGMKSPRRGVMHNVTPALLHRRAVGELRQAIEEKLARGEYSQGMRGLKQRWSLWRTRRHGDYAAWRVFLLAARPWTEYALYYSFLEATGRFLKYHEYSRHCLYDVGRSLWSTPGEQLPAGWDPGPAFAGEGPPWFLVVQSSTGISAAIVRRKLEPLLKDGAGA